MGSDQMTEAETEKISDRVDLVAATSAATNGTLQTPDANGITTPAADEPASGALTRTMAGSEPPSYLAEALIDAERLLKFSAESGTTVDDEVRHHVLQARAAGKEWMG